MSSSDSQDGWGKQFVKFTFYRVRPEVRAATPERQAEIGARLQAMIADSAGQMVTRTYSTVGTRRDVDLVLWQAGDDLDLLQNWHACLAASPLSAALDVPYSFLSMTMRSLYANPLHAGSGKRDRLRDDGGTDQYLFVYPMVKTRAWYELPRNERQRIMEEHIAIGHRYHGVKINTTYSYGLDDQEFVVAFEGNHPGEFLALVRDLRDSEASAYTERDTPMFTCRRLSEAEAVRHIGLGPTGH